ncbi:MAG: endonuclease Q family protein [Armatimonadota bacterium]
MLYHADLHIHIGRAGDGKPVKITASRDLTFANIAVECAERKGIAIAGVVDCASPPVLDDIAALLEAGEMVELPGGGLRFRDKLTIILGAEFETREPTGHGSHHVSYFPTVAQLRDFSARLARHVTNLELSSQTCRLPAAKLFAMCHEVGGMFVPAHSFTPHKSVYGACVRRLSEMFAPRELAAIPAVELGLSADSYLADRIAELAGHTFLTNSDAHSLPKIAREHNALELEEPTFGEVEMALRRQGERRIVANYGLDPRLGKYHRTVCEDCGWKALEPPPVLTCKACGSVRVTNGVLDRIAQIQDYLQPLHPSHRPPYVYQVPLEFVPKVGTVTVNKLLNRFGTEMAVLHEARADDLVQTVGSQIADLILRARTGELALVPGGGGRYGRAVQDANDLQLPLLGPGHSPTDAGR